MSTHSATDRAPRAGWGCTAVFGSYEVWASEAGSTCTRGIRFTEDAGRCGLDRPDVGDAGPLLARYGLNLRPPEQFSVERDRGWTESADTPPPRHR